MSFGLFYFIIFIDISEFCKHKEKLGSFRHSCLGKMLKIVIEINMVKIICFGERRQHFWEVVFVLLPFSFFLTN